MRAFQANVTTIFFLIVTLTALAAVSQAATPTAINYQGRLTTLAGTPVDDGTYSIMFTIYDAASGGAIEWNEKESVTTSGGLFAILLGTDTPIFDDVFKGATRYLGIQMQGEPEMTPRVALVAAPYAYRVSTVDGSSGGNVSGNINLDPSTATTGNIFKGGALFIHNFGTDNAFVGANAGNLTMTGTGNVGSGNYTLSGNTTGSYNTASGYGALLSNNSGIYNTAGGYAALASNTTGSYNTANGQGTLLSNNTGDSNTATGASALASNTTGSNNTANGQGALRNNTTGFGNTANGENALSSNATGYNNTASGIIALSNNTTGSANTASGFEALLSNTSGDQNTAGGYVALSANTTGVHNTAYGADALQSNTTGSANTCIGFAANVTAGNLFNATAIGNTATVGASNKIRLGNSAVTVIEGQVAYTFTSDKNQKEYFQPVDGNEVLRKICELSLTSWNYKNQDPQHFRHYGPMAQEFFAAFGHDGVGQCGDSVSINSGDMAGIMMIALQTMEMDREQMKAENIKLEARLEKLEASLDKLTSAASAGNTQIGLK